MQTENNIVFKICKEHENVSYLSEALVLLINKDNGQFLNMYIKFVEEIYNENI